MSHIFSLGGYLVLLALAIAAGSASLPDTHPEIEQNAVAVPYIGSVAVLNGCGISGAARAVALQLRAQGIDVKTIDNAQSWNYPESVVVSRTKDAHTAQKVASIVGVSHTTLLIDDTSEYDAIVYIGHDYKNLEIHTP